MSHFDFFMLASYIFIAPKTPTPVAMILAALFWVIAVASKFWGQP